MVILTFLQNQWFKDPDRVKALYEERPEHRNHYISRFLFMGCMTGKRLQEAFGEELCNDIIWEEASPEVAGEASGSFPADLIHMIEAINKFKPDVVVTLGAIATNGLIDVVEERKPSFVSFMNCELVVRTAEPPMQFIALTGPHPASRGNPMPHLNRIGARLLELKAEKSEVLPLE